ncbi:MAG: zinc-binding dehydrogenase [Caldilineaceae bacterium]|nr:zinc-binding dehydrogenase [Caldilineaceae bacterium]
MTFKSIVVPRRGNADVLEIVESELRTPAAGEARIKVLATPVVQDDVAMRVGNRPFLARPPFVPGYAVLGEVDAVGEGVTGVKPGDQVAALTQFGGHTEMIYWPAGKLVTVPTGLDPAQAVVLILNYLVAYQVLHRVVQVKPRDKVLVVGASGGVGTAFLDLCRLADVTAYGLASPRKHHILRKYGAAPLDYHTQDWVNHLRQAESEGLDYVFNGMGEAYFERGLALLRRGGVLVHYGGPQSFARFLLLVAKLLVYNVLPNGKTIKGYGTHRGDVAQYKEDWATLFKLLQEGKIAPHIQQTLPILEAAQANRLLESGGVVGNIVLLSPELLLDQYADTAARLDSSR